ncbi:MAG TPA: hypothetical protein VIU02_00715, partial [Burkholderiales bacterium]
MNTSSRLARCASLAAIVVATGALTGCYVVPIHPHSPSNVVPGSTSAPAPGPVTFSARLYPVNESAAVYGTVMASVTNDLNGRG